MDTVSFTAMKHGTKEDFLLVQASEHRFAEGTAARLLAELEKQGTETVDAYKITRLEHALQSATRAEADRADADWIIAALLHDIGDSLAPFNHDVLAAAILQPYVREEVTWVVQHHAVFQMVYYAQYLEGWNQFERDKYKDSPYYQTAIDFCERWDQASFDPDYRARPLAHFAPLVHEVFARKPHAPEILRPSFCLGLPAQLVSQPA